MKRAKLQSHLLVAITAVIVLMTAAALFVVHLTLKSEVRRHEREDVATSLAAFRSVQAARESQLSRSAALLAELPTLKALMSTEDQPTVQDGSEPFFRLSGSDLLMLASNTGSLLALHAKKGAWSQELASRHLREAIENRQTSGWWVDDERIYWVFLRPISAGSGGDERDLGFLVVGYEIDAGIAEELSRESRSAIVLATGGRILASTLSAQDTTALRQELARNASVRAGGRGELDLNGRRYSAASVQLADGASLPIRCFVLSSEQDAIDFLARLNRVLLLCAVLSILLGGILVQFISRAVTRPLQTVIAGIEALARGDYDYSVSAAGNLEVERLATSFSAMRKRLLESQRNLLAAERIAVLDLTASSISHDLRHFLAAVVANAEFLYDSELTKVERDEIYREIKMATDQMLDLIESMREVSREHRPLNISPAKLDETIQRSIDMVEARQECRNVRIAVSRAGDMAGNFDSRKLERVFFNLLLNACEAAGEDRDPRVQVEIGSDEGAFIVRLHDNGHGIPPELIDRIFDPFVSFGKNSGTGLGLAIANKIVSEHGGSIRVEQTSAEGTTLLVCFPCLAEQQLAVSNRA